VVWGVTIQGLLSYYIYDGSPRNVPVFELKMRIGGVGGGWLKGQASSSENDNLYACIKNTEEVAII
jgi:hypothetical protein